MKTFSELMSFHDVWKNAGVEPAAYAGLEPLIDGALEKAARTPLPTGKYFTDVLEDGIDVLVHKSVIYPIKMLNHDWSDLNPAVRIWFRSVYVVPGSGWRSGTLSLISRTDYGVSFRVQFTR
jgi:hypothetical protein